MTLFYILLATGLISLASLIGVVTLSLNKKRLFNILVFMISLSAGTLMASALLYLLPEAHHYLAVDQVYLLLLISLIFFFVLEKFLFWRHCHENECEAHSFAYVNLVGDALHNFTDGLIIASAFLIDLRLGVITSIAIALHEIPQEIGDFAVLVYAGFSRKKALFFNLLVSMTAVVGALLFYFLGSSIQNLSAYLLPIAAGSFIYIALSDLFPEIRKEQDRKRSFMNLIFFLIGVSLMFLLKFFGDIGRDHLTLLQWYQTGKPLI